MPFPYLFLGYRAHQTSESLFCTLVLNTRVAGSPHPDQGVCSGAGRGASSILSTTAPTERGGRAAGTDSKGKQEPSQGRGPRLGGDPGSASRAGSLAPPTSDNPLGFLSRAVRGALTPWTFAPGLLSAQTRRAQPSRAALTPEEALAPSSSSPLQAGDVGLTARAQKAAPRGARSPRTAVETRAQSPGYSGSGSS